MARAPRRYLVIAETAAEVICRRDRQRTALSHAHESRAVGRRRDLVARGVRGGECIRRRGTQHDAVECGEPPCRGCERVGLRAGTRHDDLGRPQAQVERVEQRAVADQVLAGRAKHALEQPVGFCAPGIIARERREPHQVAGRDRVRVRHRVVGGGGRAHHEALGVVGGEEVAAVVRIGVVAVERALPCQCLIEVGTLSRRLMERERRRGSCRRSRWQGRETAAARPARNGRAGRRASSAKK